MIEAYEDEELVRVRAQVMYRDEPTGGWVALGAGGLSNVMVGKRAAPAAPAVPAASTAPAAGTSVAALPLLNNNSRAQNGDSSGASDESGPRAHAPCYEYFIRGKRITDEEVILSCTIKKDFQYNKVMPTFHHWVTDEKRFGLTFQTAADARAFDKGVRTAIQELLDGLGGAWPSLYAYKQHNPEPCDDDTTRIFESLILPSESRSSSENSTASRTQKKQEPPLASKELLMKQKISGSSSEEPEKTLYMDHIDADYSYVQLSAVHDYTYPQLGAGGETTVSKPPLAKRDSGSIKKCSTTLYNPEAPPPLPDKKDLKPPKPEPFQARVKCRHCHEWYLESANRAGACEFAPDCFRSCIDAVTCIKCAQCMLYHCMSDAEGEFVSHPCSCGPVDQACTKRWTGISLLSLLVPCLWCYPLLRCVHGAGRSCHVVGGRHAPFRPSLPPLRHP